MTGYVYKIVNTVKGRVYIGKTTQIPEKRKSQHFCGYYSGFRGNSFIEHDWKKYGGDAFVFSVLEITDTEHLDAREKYWIAYYHKQLKFCYNLHPKSLMNRHAHRLALANNRLWRKAREKLHDKN